MPQQFLSGCCLQGLGWKTLPNGEKLWMHALTWPTPCSSPKFPMGTLAPWLRTGEHWAFSFSKLVIQAYYLNSLCLGFLSYKPGCGWRVATVHGY